MKSYQKTINLGKIDYYQKGKKTNKVTIEMEIKKIGKKSIFSCCGNIYNAKQTDFECCGQCYEEIEKNIDTNGKNII